LDLDTEGKIFSAIFMTLEFSIRPVILTQGLLPKGKKDLGHVLVEKCPRKRINPSAEKDRQK
jgi:hypothetical protein